MDFVLDDDLRPVLRSPVRSCRWHFSRAYRGAIGLMLSERVSTRRALNRQPLERGGTLLPIRARLGA